MLRKALGIILVTVFAGTAYADEIWHVKSLHHGDEHFMGVKAVDKDGNRHSIKAIEEEEGGKQILRLKAMINGKEVPVKVVDFEDKHYSVKAIAGSSPRSAG